MKKEIILKGKEFLIRPYKKGDYIFIAKNANNKNVAKNMTNIFPSPYKISDAKKWVNFNIKEDKKNKFTTNFVIDIDGMAIGSIGGHTVTGKPFILSFGYWIGEKYWNKKIVSEATKIYINYIKKNFKKIKRIEAWVFPWNKASQRVLEKNGFLLEGVMRKYYMKDKKLLDVYFYSLIND